MIEQWWRDGWYCSSPQIHGKLTNHLYMWRTYINRHCPNVLSVSLWCFIKQVQVKRNSGRGYGYIRRVEENKIAVLHVALQASGEAEATQTLASVGSKLLSLWLLDAVGWGDFGGVCRQRGVGRGSGDCYSRGRAGQSQEGDRLHPQQAREGQCAVGCAQDLGGGQGAHGCQGGGWGGGGRDWLAEGHVEVNRGSHRGRLGCGLGRL